MDILLKKADLMFPEGVGAPGAFTKYCAFIQLIATLAACPHLVKLTGNEQCLAAWAEIYRSAH